MAGPADSVSQDIPQSQNGASPQPRRDEFKGVEQTTAPDRVSPPEPVKPVGSTGYSVLSERELEIVELVSVGMTNEKIAEQLEISKRTVDNHISNILNKTATHNRVELVRWALQWGKVCLDQINCCMLPEPATIDQNLDSPSP
jgi:DNA-binding NarL/FixJ family response regulator